MKCPTILSVPDWDLIGSFSLLPASTEWLRLKSPKISSQEVPVGWSDWFFLPFGVFETEKNYSKAGYSKLVTEDEAMGAMYIHHLLVPI